MASSTLILRRYALAMHGLASETGVLEQVEAELRDLDGLFRQNEDLRQQMANPRLTSTSKKAVLTQLLGAANTDVLRRTVLLMTDKGRANLLVDLAAAYEEVAMEAGGRAVARVSSATPLDDAARSQLIESLAALTGKQITLEESIDEALLGGVRVMIGSHMIDGSLQRRLDGIEHSLLNASLAD